MFYFKFKDHLKTVSKHYMKLIDSNPNIVVGTSYATLKDCLLKIEKSGYLDHININKEVSAIILYISLIYLIFN